MLSMTQRFGEKAIIQDAHNESRIAYCDCFSGVSGNMLLGALLAAGLPEETLRRTVDALGLHEVAISVSPVCREGIAATLVEVDAAGDWPERHLADIVHLLESSALSQSVRTRSIAVFRRLAEAEAKVHGSTPEEVHFHEVGAVDALVDIVGCVAGVEFLGIDWLVASPLPLSRGWVNCRHGHLPLPAPAVCELVKGVPVVGVDCDMELVTPTGAALLCELAGEFGAFPAMQVHVVGYGAGSHPRPDGRPNLLRLFVGNRQCCEEAAEVEVIESHIDDWHPEQFPYLSERLFAAGALDVSWVPMVMKKGRSGGLLRVLADPVHGHACRQLVLAESTAIGLRYRLEKRITLPRQLGVVGTSFGPVRAKRVVTPVGAVIRPEYEDCRRLALACGVPLDQVYRAVLCCRDDDFQSDGEGEEEKCDL